MNEFDFLKKQLNDWIGHVLKVVTLTDGERIKLFKYAKEQNESAINTMKIKLRRFENMGKGRTK